MLVIHSLFPKGQEVTKRKDPSQHLPAGRPRLDGTNAAVAPVDPQVALQVKVMASQKAYVEQRAKALGISASELIRLWIERDRGPDPEISI